ncbi:hypothetical protein AUJ84_04285 [Candidatus Pacearchaeota archaeon CG1_02_32_132]|nr:MAG: hypothetical protein AUJ84_04285 [Candidatus Pacearchaeota archaeon CG1_02_32_132]
MSLTDKLGNNVKSVALAGIIGLSSSSALADTIYIDTNWTFDEINNLLDGNPETFGKDGQTDPVRNDVVEFALGTYQVPLIRDAKFKSNIDGITIIGQGPGLTIFRGNSPDGGLIWEVQGQDVSIGLFSMENSRGGLKVDGDRAYNNVYVGYIDSEGLDIHYIYDQQKASGRIDTPSVFVDHLNLIDGTTSFHWNDRDQIVDYTDKFMEGDNVSIDGTGNGIDPPMIIEDGHVIETRGTDWRNCLFQNMQSTFVPRAYEGLPGRLSGNAPSFCGESNINHATLYELGIGVGNWEENNPNKFLDNEGRPIWGSIATGPWYKDRQNRFIGYIGAKEPAFIPRVSAVRPR